MTERMRTRAKSTFSSFRYRNFKLFFVGQVVSNSGNWLTNVALTLLVLHATHNGVAVGALIACQYGPILLFSAWAGVIADRSDKRKLLMLTQTLEMGQSFALGVLAFLPHTAVGWYFIVAAIGGILLAFDNPVRRSFVNEMVPLDAVPNAVTLYSALVNITRIIGPALAGLLIVTVGYGWCFTLDAISYLVVLIALAMMRTSELRRAPATVRAKGQVRQGVRYVRSRTDLWMPFVMLAAVGTLSYNFSVVFPLFVEGSLGGSDGTFTLVYSTFSVGALAGALVVANRNRVRLLHIVAGGALLGATMLVLSVMPTVAFTFPVVLAVGASSVAYMTATTALVQVRSDPTMIGRVLALQTVLLIGTAPIGGPIMGALADAFGGRSPLVVGGVVALCAAAWGAWIRRRMLAHGPVHTDQPVAAEEHEVPATRAEVA